GRSGGSLRRWINGRGETGNRPRKCMSDRRRRGVQGTRIHPVALQIVVEKGERYFIDRRVSAKDVYVEVRVALASINAERVVKSLVPIPVPGRTTVWRWLSNH